MSATQADLAKTEAQSRTAATDLKRKAELQQRRAISQSEYDAAVAKADEAKAGVAAAQARIEAARVRLGVADWAISETTLEEVFLEISHRTYDAIQDKLARGAVQITAGTEGAA